MTPESIALVKQSWKKVSPISSTAADLFYTRLFEMNPELRELFPEDMQEQKVKLMQTLAFCVHGLDHLSEIVDDVKALGQRHAEYRVRPEHYPMVGAALLWTLEQGLGADFKPQTRQAWSEVYTVLAETMISASQAA